MSLLLSAPSLAVSTDSASFEVSASTQVVTIPSRYVGFSIEVGSAPLVFLQGGFGGEPRTSFSSLMNRLRRAANNAEGPSVRIGGNSADESAWVPSPTVLPVNTTYRITEADLASYAAVIPTFNGSVIIGTTLLYPYNTALPVAHYAAAVSAINWTGTAAGFLESFEIGNEPDLFAEKNMGGRPSSFGYDDYKKQYAVVDAAFSAQGGRVPTRHVQGATWCSPRWTLANFTDYVTTFNSTLDSISFHRYGTTSCHGAKTSVQALLADKASEGLAASLADFSAEAARVGLPFYVGEGNSVSCGGAAGVSDVMAAALWALDTLFNVAVIGVKRWAFHGMPHGAYSTIVYPDDTAATQVSPLYYGILAFAQMTANLSSVVRVNTLSSSNAAIKAWAVVDGTTKFVRTVVIHKDPSEGLLPANITIVLADGLRGGTATMTRLLPGRDGLLTKWDGGLTLGGLSWSFSSDGEPTGDPVSEKVTPAADGSYAFLLPPYSAAFLEIII